MICCMSNRDFKVGRQFVPHSGSSLGLLIFLGLFYPIGIFDFRCDSEMFL